MNVRKGLFWSTLQALEMMLLGRIYFRLCKPIRRLDLPAKDTRLQSMQVQPPAEALISSFKYRQRALWTFGQDLSQGP